MKKIWLLGMSLLVAFGVSACALNPTSTLSTTTTTSASTTTTTTTTTTTAPSSTTTERGDETMNIHLDFDLTGISFAPPTVPIEMHSLIADHAVFQQNKPIRIFGEATPGTIVLVKLTKDYEPQTHRKAYGIADESGQFLIELAALEASFSTYTLTVSDTLNEVRVTDLLIGEVWVAGGQSNMGMSVREIDEGDVLMARAEQNAIRIFYQANGMDAGIYPFTPDNDVQNGYWLTADSGANIASCSAIGYVFAYELYYRFITDGKEVPIAILNTQKGGAMIQSYLPRQAMLDNNTVRNYVLSRGYDFLESAYNSKGNNNYQQPAALYNRKVAPLMNFNINGVIWYQGESDANYASNLQTIPMLMETWSQGFNKNDELLPFVFIQLAPFDGADYDLGPSTQLYTYHAFAEHRLAQLAVVQMARYKDNAILIPIYDVSLKWNVPTSQFAYQNPIHPVTKKIIGERAGKAAYTQFYQGENDYLAPMLSAISFDATTITLTFDHVGPGLKLIKNAILGVLTMEVVLKNGQRQTVDCRIIAGNQVRITGVDTANVAFVAYSNFSRNEASNLASGYNVPALPFKVPLV